MTNALRKDEGKKSVQDRNEKNNKQNGVEGEARRLKNTNRTDDILDMESKGCRQIKKNADIKNPWKSK